jgi:thioredoxin 1
MKNIHKGYNPDYSEEDPAPELVKELTGDAVLEFGAPWCGYCQAAQPAIQEVLSAYSGVTHIKIYDGKGKRLGRTFRVKLWPTLILLHDGKEVDRLVRPSTSDEIRRLLN